MSLTLSKFKICTSTFVFLLKLHLLGAYQSLLGFCVYHYHYHYHASAASMACPDNSAAATSRAHASLLCAVCDAEKSLEFAVSVPWAAPWPSPSPHRLGSRVLLLVAAILVQAASRAADAPTATAPAPVRIEWP